MALYALVAALAETEVEALRERTVAGLKNARAKGKRVGRPPMGTAEIAKIVELQGQGLRQHEIAVRLGVSRAYISRKLALHKSSPKPTS
jgi:DNA invertase Pin-like site-specific DNA recombinase